jgi:hypothetical protein
MTKLFLSAFCICLIISCNSDSKTAINESLLIGNWTLTSATRDGKITKTLENAFINFENDKELYCNIFQEQQPLLYELNKSNLLIKTIQPFTFKITTLDSINLSLKGEISKYDMVLNFAKNQISQDTTEL